MTAATIAAPDEAGQRKPRGRPFERGVSQKALFAQSRAQMVAEVTADLERDGRKVTSADRLLVARYVELIRSKSHSSTNSALKIWQVLADKYTGEDKPNASAFDRYLAAKKDAP
jgi:hypothetical protein